MVRNPKIARAYRKPQVVEFGSLRDLTQVGCGGPTDGETFMGGVGVGNDATPRFLNGTTLWCFIGRS